MKCEMRNADRGVLNPKSFRNPRSAFRISSQVFHLVRYFIKSGVPIDLALGGLE